MAAAQAKIASLLGSCDVVLEVRDARLPFTSAHPGLGALCGERPRVVVFNKADLSSDYLRPRIEARLQREGLPCVFTSAAGGSGSGATAGGGGGGGGGRAPGLGRLLALVDSLPTRASRFKAAGSLMAVVGLPNTGKSSLINALRVAAGWRGGGEGRPHCAHARLHAGRLQHSHPGLPPALPGGHARRDDAPPG